MYPRRKFLKTASMLSAGLALTSFGALAGCKTAAARGRYYNSFGLQLYTLRDVLPKDPVGILQQVAHFGYRQIESYEGPKGMFWGMKNTEFKKLMDDLGMTILSSHCDYKNNFEQKAAEAAAIGMKYLICPWYGAQKNIDDYKKAADDFNHAGAICKQHGLRFGYHNHDYSFRPTGGIFPQDILMQQTDKNLVDFEMDIYWVVTAGENPITWFEKYPGRFTLAHVKDRQKNAPSQQQNASCILGKGSIDFETVFRAGKKNGLQYYIVEQEQYVNTTPIAAAKEDAQYMQQMEK